MRKREPMADCSSIESGIQNSKESISLEDIFGCAPATNTAFSWLVNAFVCKTEEIKS